MSMIVPSAAGLAGLVALVAAGLDHRADRLDAAAVGLAATLPHAWRGPAAAAFATAVREVQHDLSEAASATREAAVLARRAAAIGGRA